MVNINIFSDDDMLWIFYSNKCRLEIELFLKNDTFSMGDMLFINWNLIRADALYRSIYITSDDITNINHTMKIDEDGYCTLTSLYTALTTPCDSGIAISQLSTYNIAKSDYSVLVTAQHAILSNDSLINNVTVYQKEFMFKRNKMAIDVTINHTGGGIYGGSYIYFNIEPNQTVATQPNGTITINTDPGLSISDDNIISIHLFFYDVICFIKWTENHHINCADPFLIPSNMTAKPIHDNNYSIYMHSNDVLLSEESKVHYLSRKIQTLSLNISRVVFLGDVIQINLTTIGDIITQSSSKLFVTSTDLDIDVIVDIDYGNNEIDNCEIESPSTKTRKQCTAGIAFNRLRTYMIGETYHLMIHSQDTYLTQYMLPIQITHCDIGSGLLINTENNHTNIPCTKCAVNTINIYPNSKCLDCDNIEGISCLGASDLKISFNYWMTFDSKNNKLISSYCPSGYCCLKQNGCFYNNASIGLCANNRNASLPLCGGCNSGYVEVFGSTNCMKCARNHYEYLVLPIFIALMYVMILAHVTSNAESSASQQEINYTKVFVKDDLEAIKIAALRPMVYLFQGLAVITVQTGYAFYLQPLLDIFSMQFIVAGDNGDSGICFTKSLTAIQEEIWYLFYPFSMFIIIFIYYMLHTKLRAFKCRKCRPNFSAAFWQTFLICIGAVLSKMFKILACRTVANDETVHFYAGNVKCYGFAWILCAISLLIIIVIWCGIWYYLYKMAPDKRASGKAVTKNLTHFYKTEFWYYEFVLITRRILLAFIITFNYLSESFTQYILLSILIFYLTIHLKYQPFKHQRVNHFETLCIILLILGLTALGFKLNKISPLFVSFILSSILFIPLMLFIYFITRAIKTYHQQKNDLLTETQTANKLNAWRRRMTPSQRSVFDASTQDLKGTDDRTINGDGDSEIEIEGIAMTNTNHKGDNEKRVQIGASRVNILTEVDTLDDELHDTSSSESIP